MDFFSCRGDGNLIIIKNDKIDTISFKIIMRRQEWQSKKTNWRLVIQRVAARVDSRIMIYAPISKFIIEFIRI